jgi:hypothetical protein
LKDSERRSSQSHGEGASTSVRRVNGDSYITQMIWEENGGATLATPPQIFDSLFAAKSKYQDFIGKRSVLASAAERVTVTLRKQAWQSLGPEAPTVFIGTGEELDSFEWEMDNRPIPEGRAIAWAEPQSVKSSEWPKLDHKPGSDALASSDDGSVDVPDDAVVNPDALV